MSATVQLHQFELFCYTCKRHFTYSAEDRKAALARFRAQGHGDSKVPALAPDLGRTSRRYEKAIETHRAKEAEERRKADLEREAAKKSKEIQG